MKYNHTLNTVFINFSTQAGSRNRIRVPSVATAWAKFEPGTRVSVEPYRNGRVIRSNPNGKYTVEKDGAIRFPAPLGLGRKVRVLSNALKGYVKVY